MIIDKIIIAGAENAVNAEGAFIYIESADGLIEVTTDTGRSYQLNRRDQVRVPEGEEFQKIAIRNLHTADNHVVVKTGFGKFYPANDNANTVAVITELPNIEIAGGQALSVNNFPSDFEISNLPAVQGVSQSGEWNVSIENFPAVEFAQVKPATYAPLNKADFAANNHVIAANLNRTTLGIKADPNNTSEIWVGSGVGNGLPLFAGETMVLNTTAEINLYSVDVNNNCYLAEEVS